MLDTFGGDLLQSCFDGPVKRRGDTHGEAASYECQAKWFARHFGELHADAALDALAGLKDHAAGLDELVKWLARGAKPTGIGLIDLRIMLERASAC